MRQTVTLAVLAVLTLLAGACAAPHLVTRSFSVSDVILSASAGAESGVHVHAVDGLTGSPVRVVVIVKLDDDGYVETDANGDVSLPVPPGRHTLTVAVDDGVGHLDDVTAGTDVEAKIYGGGCMIIQYRDPPSPMIDSELVGSKLTWDAHDLHNLPR